MKHKKVGWSDEQISFALEAMIDLLNNAGIAERM